MTCGSNMSVTYFNYFENSFYFLLRFINENDSFTIIKHIQIKSLRTFLDNDDFREHLLLLKITNYVTLIISLC